MICKWCGANLTSTDNKCKRCGKDVPALSDCGGFYDLVPNARKATEGYTEPVVVPEKPISPPQHSETPKGMPPARSKKSSKKSLLGLTVITILGFVLVVILLVNMLGKINQHTEAINALQTDIQNITEKSDVATEPPTTGSSDVLDPVLSQQNVVFKVTVNGDEEKKVDTSLDLGDYSDTAVITYDTVDATGLISFASYTLKEADTSTSFTIDYTSGVRTQDISVNYVIDDALYGVAETSPIFKWQYRFDEASEWKELPEDIFTQTDDNGQTKISIKESALQELIEDNEGSPELRCEIYCTTADGGSLTIVVEGIEFHQDANNEKQIIG